MASSRSAESFNLASEVFHSVSRLVFPIPALKSSMSQNFEAELVVLPAGTLVKMEVGEVVAQPAKLRKSRIKTTNLNRNELKNKAFNSGILHWN